MSFKSASRAAPRETVDTVNPNPIPISTWKPYVFDSTLTVLDKVDISPVPKVIKQVAIINTGKVLFFLLLAAPPIVLPIADAPNIGRSEIPAVSGLFPLTTWKRRGRV